MDRLPPEVLKLIIGELHYPPDPSHFTNSGLKALRLTCKVFAETAAEYLFCDLWLFMEKDSFAKLEAISGHPTHRHQVQSLKFFQSCCTPTCYPIPTTSAI